ncbi:MAG: GTP-dependent dephospho-CoA kinase family protein [Acidilobus sp.]
MSSEVRILLQFRVKDKDREDFSWPRGLLVSGDLSEFIRAAPWRKVICVGDVVSRYCLSSGRPPDVIVIDGKTRRQEMADAASQVSVEHFEKLVLDNPAGGISPAAIEALCDAMKRPSRSLVVVRGEEDMLALAALMCAEPGSLVIYGIPGKGASLVVVDQAIAREAQTRLLRLELQPVSLR